MKKQWWLSVCVFSLMVFSGVTYRVVVASDHDDGETDVKSRALNLTDHYVWKDTTDPTKLNFIQFSNPRSLPGYQYHFSSMAYYDIHVTRVANKTAVPAGTDDVVFRFQFSTPNASNVQAVTFSVLRVGQTLVGNHTGATTNLADSKAGTITTNTAQIGGHTYTYFAGMREDTFFFDVVRFFQVRAFLADRILAGNTSASLANTCAGAAFDGTAGTVFNPANCAPDFTKNYNVNAIVLQVPIAALQSSAETTFDTWSTISRAQ